MRIGLAALAAVAAFSVVFAIARLGDQGPRRFDDDRSVTSLELPTRAGATTNARPPELETPAASAESSPEDAVEAYLDAERDGDFARSFALLSATEQEQSSVTDWVALHADLPEILDFEIVPGAATAATGRAEVSARAKLHAELNEVVGLIPASAELTFTTVQEDDGWRVAFADSLIDPIYLSDATAATDVRAWVEERAGCDPQAASSAGLLGPGAAGLVDRLCAAKGTIEVESPQPLQDTPDADPYVAAFGPDVLNWARVVRVAGPAEVDVVVAPVGERWQVIGASQPAA
jgi:hypothetical protein